VDLLAVAVPVTLITALLWILWFEWTVMNQEAVKNEQNLDGLERSLEPRSTTRTPETQLVEFEGRCRMQPFRSGRVEEAGGVEVLDAES